MQCPPGPPRAASYVGKRRHKEALGHLDSELPLCVDRSLNIVSLSFVSCGDGIISHKVTGNCIEIMYASSYPSSFRSQVECHFSDSKD